MSDWQNILRGLNNEQREAVKTVEGPLLVLAGAGTGKTRVITFRIAWMLKEGILPDNILALTFTNKAAREMKERIAELVSEDQAKKLTVGTFHSFCIRVLRQEIKRLNYLPSFTIADTSDQEGIIKQAMAMTGYSAVEDISAGRIAAYIGKQKNQLIDYRSARKQSDNDLEARMAYVYEHYQTLLETQNMLDFDDMLLLTYELFNRFPEVLEKYRERYKYILVDEYQDTNYAQFSVVKFLCGSRNNLCVVGDDDQSIYGWRGADVGNILKFPEIFPGTVQVKLEQNYRSTNNILKAANAVIAANAERFEKNLWSAHGDGDPIWVVPARSNEDEAAFIADYLLQERSAMGLEFKDFAILYRSNHLSRLFELALRKAGVPYRLVGGQEFFQRKEIKDAAAYLKLLVNPLEDQSLLRILSVPPRGLGDKAVNRLKELKSAAFLPFSTLLKEEAFHRSLPPKSASEALALANCMDRYRAELATPGGLAEKVRNYLTDVGYYNGLQKVYKNIEDSRKRQENVEEFLNAIAEFEHKAEKPPTLMDYLESYSLLEENDRTEEPNDGNAVTLSTVHASKGLEYPFVFLAAMERNIFPHERSIEEGSMDEELRLFYVALTRAKLRLIITFCRMRALHGRINNQTPSRFLSLLPEEIAKGKTPDDLLRYASSDEMEKFFAMFNPGD
jgi:superfamily I DNA/RNA helicase